MTRTLVRGAGALALAGLCAGLFAAWLAPDDLLSLWTLGFLCH